MQRPLSEHIVRLEEKINILKKVLRNADLPDYERSEREISLQNAEEALSFSATASMMNWFRDMPSVFANSPACRRIEVGSRKGNV